MWRTTTLVRRWFGGGAARRRFSTKVRLSEYQVPPVRVSSLRLSFELARAGDAQVGKDARVRGRFEVRPWPSGAQLPRELDLDAHETLSVERVRVDGEEVDVRAALDARAGKLRVPLGAGADVREVEVDAWVAARGNTALEGLYASGSSLLTQCEAEGFRRIFPFLDRPDVLTTYTTRVEAPRDEFPVLLSNGNRVRGGPVDGGRHFVEFEDPWPKPSYLFALVAGDFDVVQDDYTTADGRDVKLSIYVQKGDAHRTEWAMESLKRSFKWDEERFGLQYDLDEFNLVATPDFNMGAMENKSLNVFNSKYVLCAPETTTDDERHQIESVIGHEYFHNWTGNRITCRDWFQLSLKEGLTVFRDQEFSADMSGSPAWQRVQDVQALDFQRKEDMSALRHPVRPTSYEKIDNFYTATVYQKGAEVVRMYQTLLGRDGFRRGMDLYVQRHDGSAATVEDFTLAMSDANVDLLPQAALIHPEKQFFRWYTQAGTPTVKVVKREFDAAARTMTVALEQSVPDEQEPQLIPVKVGLVDRATGESVAFEASGSCMVDGEVVLLLSEASQEFVFTGVSGEGEPVVSWLRDYSAPVVFDDDDVTTLEERIVLMRSDPNLFSRWFTTNQVQTRLLKRVAEEGGEVVDKEVVEALRGNLKELYEGEPDDGAARLFSRCLELPSPTHPDPVALGMAKEKYVERVGAELADEIAHALENSRATVDSLGYRALENGLRRYQCASGVQGAAEGALEAALKALEEGDMTMHRGALRALCALETDNESRVHALRKNREFAGDDSLLKDAWLRLQALSRWTDVAVVRQLAESDAFEKTVPNSVYSLYGAFCMGNPSFHAADGSGYAWLCSELPALDKLNPHVAARLATSLASVSYLDDSRKDKLRASVKALLDGAQGQDLSGNLLEVLKSTL